MSNHGIHLEAPSGFTLVQVETWGECASAGAAIGAAFDSEVPLEPNTVVVGEPVSVFWFGPTAWLIKRNGVSTGELPRIDASCVVDVSDAHRLFRLKGKGAVELLSTGCPLDFAAERHGPGRCAHTIYNHFPIFVYRGSESAFDLYVPRSYAEDFEAVISLVNSS